MEYPSPNPRHNLNKAEGVWRTAFAPREELNPVEFAKKYIRIGHAKNNFNIDDFPWLEEPMITAPDYTRWQQMLFLAAQLGKGISSEASLCYFIKNDPADITWYGDTIESVGKYSEQRIIPMLKNCEAIAEFFPDDGDRIRKAGVLFKHMALDILAANETNTQSATRRIMFWDEVWHWKAGMMASAAQRAEAPTLRGRRKIIGTTTGGVEDCESELFWDSAEQRIWHSACPSCHHVHPFKFSEHTCRRIPNQIPAFTIVWDENETTRPGGEWNIEELKKTVRLLCPTCKERFEENPTTLRQLKKTGHYITLNKNFDSEKIAWWAPRQCSGSWAQIAAQFVIANRLRQQGFEDLFKEFILKVLCERYLATQSMDIETNPTGDYTLANPPETFVWEKEVRRFMTVDHQAVAPYFWFIVQAWSVNGESRIVELGYCDTWESIKAIAVKHGLDGYDTQRRIWRSQQVAIDAGYDHTTVWGQCAQNCWLALRGDDAESYLHPSALPGKPGTMRYYSKGSKKLAGLGSERQNPRFFCIEHSWSNISIKDILYRLKSGQGLYYGIAKDTPKYFFEHMDSEARFSKLMPSGKKRNIWQPVNKRRANHLWDCACMNLVMAFMHGLIPSSVSMAQYSGSETIEIDDSDKAIIPNS